MKKEEKCKPKSDFSVKNKKGQFYIIASIIIILVVAGLSGVKTYVNIKQEPRTINEVSAELKEESFRVVDYGVYEKQNLTQLLNNFTTGDFGPYFKQKTDNIEIVMVYGNNADLMMTKYEEISNGDISATIGSTSVEWNGNVEGFFSRTMNYKGEIIVTVSDKNYTLKVDENQIFYFIMVQEKDGEKYIVTS